MQEDAQSSTEKTSVTERDEAVTTTIRQKGKSVYEKMGEYQSGPKSQAKAGDKVGRNDPCPCGSGKKYKKCCGK
jgi:uncharacterized protein YecA (UPF0149 family)